MLPFLPALILLPFLMLNSNRQPRAWLVLIPFGLIAGILLVGQVAPSKNLSSALDTGYPFVLMLAGGLCILCLMTYAMPSWSLSRKLLIIPALSVLPGGLSLLLTQGAREPQTLALTVTYALSLFVLLLSFALAGRGCRKGWSLRRFVLSTLLWSFVFVVATVMIALSITIAIGQGPPSMVEVIPPLLIVPATLTAVLFGVAFPFILTVFLSPFYRERLMAVFGITPNSRTEQPPAGEDPLPPSDVVLPLE